MSEGTSSVISNIFNAWEPCTAACKQYCGPEDLQGLFISLIRSTIDKIVAEYDTLADQLGRNFVNGDGE
jgi:hypothetical protein